jgi:glycosyltransferase involved in cell wall biosynthesis
MYENHRCMKTIDTTTWETALTMNPSIPGFTSVIICCRNGENFLREAIASVLAQTSSHYELLIIDNDSTDSTPDIVAEYSAEHPKICYICHENQGLVRSRNRGIREARGEYIVFLDHDDKLLPHAIASGVAAFETGHQDCGFVFGRSCQLRPDGSLDYYASCRELERYQARLHYDYQVFLDAHARICPMSSILFRRDVLIALHGFSPKAGIPDNDEICLRISRQYPVYAHPRIIAAYRSSNSGQTRRHMVQARRDIFRIWTEQAPFVKGDLALKKALRRGKVDWDYVYTVGTILVTIDYIKQKNWRTAIGLMLALLTRRRFFICLLVAIHLIRDRRKFERSVTSTPSWIEFAQQMEKADGQSSLQPLDLSKK